MTELPKILEDFIVSLESSKKSYNTIRSYRNDLEVWMRDLGLNDVTVEYLDQLTLGDLNKYFSCLDKSKSTISRKMSCFKSLYSWLVDDEGLIANNPTLSLKNPTPSKKVKRYLSIEESIKLIDSVNKDNSEYPERDRAILYILVENGLRKSEVPSINKSDIIGDCLIAKGKGDKEREVYLSEGCLKAIDEYLKVRIESGDDALFTTERKERISSYTIGMIAKKYLKKIKKDNMSTHSLRHTAASRMCQEGADIRAIQEFLGHADIKTTEGYTHTSGDSKRKLTRNTCLENFRAK